ncbi:hypothetical protein EVG20_g2281 [Dentipellis fragilis]|uniref:NAD(P)-binding protein n=1 Tax=Dentipellis fragilis TaxID=205917 RepID=A0A4Y9Z7A2_9AGAM|nr:hypothetical protein EVG20_g2281 [Dentipellis fragilis]
MSNSSRVWFVTGTSSGLGLSLVTEVLVAGERVVATARNPASSKGLVSLQSKYPESQLLVLRLDVTDAPRIKEVFDLAVQHFHRIDVVVNNAGYGVTAEIEATPDKVAREQVETLFWGPVNVTKQVKCMPLSLCGPPFTAICTQALHVFRTVNAPGEGGRVLNISSIGGYSANPTLAYYNAAKFGTCSLYSSSLTFVHSFFISAFSIALEGFTEAFDREMPPAWNIKGIIIEPGAFPTTWRDGDSVPPHPDYPPDAPSVLFRQMTLAYTPIGDLSKAAKAMIKMAGEKNPPARVQLGSDSFGILVHEATKTIKEAEQWQEVAHGTNKDGIDGNKVLEQLRAALR